MKYRAKPGARVFLGLLVTASLTLAASTLIVAAAASADRAQTVIPSYQITKINITNLDRSLPFYTKVMRP